MKRLIFTILLCLIALPAWANPFMAAATGQKAQVSGWSCGSYVAAITSDTAGDTGVVSLTANALGQSFTISSSTPIHSIEVYAGYATAGSDATIRIGTAKDLSTYVVECTINDATNLAWNLCGMTAGEVTLEAGTYYWGAVETAGDFRLTYDRTAAYADGIKTLATGSSGWLLGNDDTYDFWFKINECQ
jgi:hypothetical protein